MLEDRNHLCGGQILKREKKIARAGQVMIKDDD